MRYYNSTPPAVANESITSYMLTKHMVSDPDILPGITRLWRNEVTQLSSIFADRGMFSKGLAKGVENSKYKVVSQNHVQFAIESSDRQVVRIVEGPAGATFVCDAYPTTPGKRQSVITIYVDRNWLSPKDVFEFGDGNTYGWIYDERLPEQQTNGSWAINFKIVASSLEAYIDPDMLKEQAEIGFVMTAFEHDFSETAYEKYTFDGWGHAFMTLQRMKYSWSGYGAAMKESKKWVQANNGSMAFLTEAEDKMMKRWAGAHEFANVFGKGTVSVDNEVLTKDSRGREVMIGSGLLNQGDEAFVYPIHEWNRATLEGMLSDIRIKTGKNGKIEVVAALGIANYNSFTRFMRRERILSKTDVVWEKSTEGSGIQDTYTYYEFSGVRFIPILYNYFHHPDRPKIVSDDGTIYSHWEGVILSLANTSEGDSGIEMITLKNRYKMGTVNGINEGGENMANSIDGGHRHILFQSGIINRNTDSIARMYRPIKKIRA